MNDSQITIPQISELNKQLTNRSTQNDTYLGRFLIGLKEAFQDITSLEVNTMVVTEITGFKFNPLTTYEEFYWLQEKEDSFINALDIKTKQDSPQSIVIPDKFRQLFKKHFENNFGNIDQFIQSNRNSSPHKRPDRYDDFIRLINRFIGLKVKLKTDYQAYESRRNKKIEKEVTLPSPESDFVAVRELLEDGTFLRELRRLRELAGLLKGENAVKQSNIYDLIYAQTVIQIDGDTMNRFHQNLFEPAKGVDEEDKQFLIKTHQDAVASGTTNWHDMLTLVLKLMESVSKVIFR